MRCCGVAWRAGLLVSARRAPRATTRIAVAAASLLTTACRPQLAALPLPAATAAYAVAADDSLRVFRFGVFADSIPRPAVLLLHGGGWSAGAPTSVFPAARAFADAGFVAFAVQYRLSDSLRTPVESLADVCAALRWTRLLADSLGVDSNRVAVYGVASGGHLAASTATIGCPEAINEPGADALLLLSPALDVASDSQLTRLLRGRASAAELSPVNAVRAAMPPTFVVQGSDDRVTPLTGAQRFCLLVVRTRATCDLRIYEGLGHLLTAQLDDQSGQSRPDPLASNDALRHLVQALVRLWSPNAPLDSP